MKVAIDPSKICDRPVKAQEEYKPQYKLVANFVNPTGSHSPSCDKKNTN